MEKAAGTPAATISRAAALQVGLADSLRPRGEISTAPFFAHIASDWAVW